MIWSCLVVFRVKEDFVERFIITFVIEENKSDYNSVVGQFFDLTIQLVNITTNEAELPPVSIKDDVVRILRQIEDLGQYFIESGVFDSKSDGVLQPFEFRPFLLETAGKGLCWSRQYTPRL